MSSNNDFSDFLTELRNRTNIREVVESYIPLKHQRGSDYVACCPFHNEKTPSFYVHEAQKYFHCFGCSKGGDVVKFVMEIESVDFIDAVKILAERLHMSLPEYKSDSNYSSTKERKTKLKEIMLDANRFYYNNLINKEAGKPALEYLESRGFGREIIDKYRLGVSLDKTSLQGYLRRKEYSLSDIESCGLIYGKEHIDSFSNRIIVPIQDSFGNVIAFGGRIYKPEDKDNGAKYKNSNTNEIFEKSNYVYGLNFIRDARIKGQRPEQLILVEGYMDVIALGSAGINNVIAGMGTALTEGQISQTKKTTQNVLVCYDGDEAGRNATKKNAPMLENAGLNIKIMYLPEGKDPDEVIKTEGVDAFNYYMDNALSLIEFRLKLCELAFDLNTNSGRASYVKAAIVALSDLTSETDLDIYMNIVVEKGRVTRESLKREIEKHKLTHSKNNEAKEETTKQDTAKSIIKAQFFVANRAINSCSYVNKNELVVDWFEEPSIHEVIRWFKDQTGEIVIGNLYSDIPQTPIIDKVVEVQIPKTTQEKEITYYYDCLIKLANAYLQKNIDNLKKKSQETDDEEERRKYIIQISLINKKKNSKIWSDKYLDNIDAI